MRVGSLISGRNLKNRQIDPARKVAVSFNLSQFIRRSSHTKGRVEITQRFYLEQNTSYISRNIITSLPEDTTSLQPNVF